MQQGIQVLDTPPGRVRTPLMTGWLVLALVVLTAGVATAGFATVTRSGQSAASTTVRAREPQRAATVVTGSPAIASASAARALLAAAPSVVLVGAGNQADVAAAAAIARRAHAPLLLLPASGTAGQVAALRSTIRALAPSAVLALGVARRSLAADLPGVHLVAAASALPVTAAAAPMRSVAVLVHTGGSAAASALAIAATATAQAAGARVIDLPGYDPRADQSAIRALAAARPQHVVGVGAGFGSAGLLAARTAVAETGKQLPGGGQVLFPARRIVALYGTPGTPVLGVLGHQGLTRSIARAKAAAAQYAALSKVPVIASFEIIASVAQASAGPSGTYSDESSVRALRPWVTAASKAGLYVTLDLQPGRASLLDQAKSYRSLLKLPNVGLALDPEWQLKPRQLPLRQIGTVSVSEVNKVASWLASLTAKYRLPQKLLELHEFRLTMIQNLQRLDTRHDDLAIVINMDGQGAPGTKQQTWRAVVANAPRGVYFGWKDFYVKDTPMLNPAQTMLHRPVPVLISYQ
ncbi:MAG TPA: hypothetical protein VGH96_12210 [Streptosporangiaceae bacterium]